MRGTQAGTRFSPPDRQGEEPFGSLRGPAGIRENDDRRFEPLGAMHRHHANLAARRGKVAFDIGTALLQGVEEAGKRRSAGCVHRRARGAAPRRSPPPPRRRAARPAPCGRFPGPEAPRRSRRRSCPAPPLASRRAAHRPRRDEDRPRLPRAAPGEGFRGADGAMRLRSSSSRPTSGRFHQRREREVVFRQERGTPRRDEVFDRDMRREREAVRARDRARLPV